jgi:hypothetical protein
MKLRVSHFYGFYVFVVVHIGFYMQSIVYESYLVTRLLYFLRKKKLSPYITMFCNMFSGQVGRNKEHKKEKSK